jgi:hypothetical protein
VLRRTARTQNKETINTEESQEYEPESLISEDTTSEIQDPAPSTHYKGLRKRVNEVFNLLGCYKPYIGS